MDVLNLLRLEGRFDLSPMDLFLGGAMCLFAIWLGVSLAKRQAQTFQGQRNGKLPAVTYVDYGDMRFLHLGTPWVQGSMKISQPFEIHLDYVQRMMGWMLFTDLDQIPNLRAMQLGLGAGSLTKFCHHFLGMHTTAIELNPEVIATCKTWFHLPANDNRLEVQVGDAADIAQDSQWHGKIDVLQVDLYDQEAAMPVLDNQAFYADCKKLLTANGCMAVNLYGRDSNLQHSLQHIAQAFGPGSVWAFKPTPAGNSVVLAFQTAPTIQKDALLSQAQKIESRWPLPATKWLKFLAPL